MFLMMRKISEEITRFMRGKYALDEIGNGVDELI
jgi:microcompartment protein CcmK/EutM